MNVFWKSVFFRMFFCGMAGIMLVCTGCTPASGGTDSVADGGNGTADSAYFAFTVENGSEFEDFVLTGIKDGVSVPAIQSSFDTYDKLTDARLPAQPGEWTFTMTALRSTVPVTMQSSGTLSAGDTVVQFADGVQRSFDIVTDLKSGYDCILKKLNLVWTRPACTLKAIYIRWTADDGRSGSCQLSGTDNSFTIDQVQTDSSVYTFSVTTVNRADTGSYAVSVQTAAGPYYTGQIIYLSSADSTYSGLVTSSPAGVVYDVFKNGTAYRMVALKDIAELAWADDARYYYRFISQYTKDMSYLDYGKIVCDKVFAYCKDKGWTDSMQTAYPAVWNCCRYAPVKIKLSKEEQTGWYLPSYTELKNMYAVKSAIQPAFAHCSGTYFSSEYYWSASPAQLDISPSKSWLVNPVTGEENDCGPVGTIHWKDDYHVRAVYISAVPD